MGRRGEEEWMGLRGMERVVRWRVGLNVCVWRGGVREKGSEGG